MMVELCRLKNANIFHLYFPFDVCTELPKPTSERPSSVKIKQKDLSDKKIRERRGEQKSAGPGEREVGRW